MVEVRILFSVSFLLLAAELLGCVCLCVCARAVAKHLAILVVIPIFGRAFAANK